MTRTPMPTPETVVRDLTRFIAEVARRFREQQELAERARLRLAEAIREGAGAGVRQVDIVRATGYTREQVRKIVKAEVTQTATDDH